MAEDALALIGAWIRLYRLYRVGLYTHNPYNTLIDIYLYPLLCSNVFRTNVICMHEGKCFWCFAVCRCWMLYNHNLLFKLNLFYLMTMIINIIIEVALGEFLDIVGELIWVDYGMRPESNIRKIDDKIVRNFWKSWILAIFMPPTSDVLIPIASRTQHKYQPFVHFNCSITSTKSKRKWELFACVTWKSMGNSSA